MPNKQTISARVFTISPNEINELQIKSVQEISALRGSVPVIWVDFDSPLNTQALAEIGEIFQLHPLSLKDVLSARQRPKIEHFPDYQFIVTKMVYLEERLKSEQLSIFFGENFVLTFQEKAGGDCLGALRESLRLGAASMRATSSDYLAYALIDMVVDGFFPVIKTIGDRLNDLEDEIFHNYNQQHAHYIHAIKRDIAELRRTIWPVRDALALLQREHINLVQNETRHYLRDCYDHALRIMELVESHQAMCSDLMDLLLSRENSRMNEILRVLTIISTIFIPPTFVAGIYGMNFHGDKSPLNMPELDWYWGYPFALSIMGLIMGGLLFWMWRNGWLTKVPSKKPVKNSALSWLPKSDRSRKSK
ncbi:magnesium/cobalt transporter CorA [bacterium]|nr:magnesium/cobalt transporter CorA [bacterium]MBP9811300.1 magnesium/cobalt transporter CorA [bacterium]